MPTFSAFMAAKMLQMSVKRTVVYTHTVVNGVRLESIELKEAVLDGHIAHKVECLHRSHCTDPILFVWQVPGLRSP